jgi:hypothetical protein
LISHKLLCENNFGFFLGGHCHSLFVFGLYSFAWKSRFTPKFFFLSAMLPLSEPPL